MQSPKGKWMWMAFLSTHFAWLGHQTHSVWNCPFTLDNAVQFSHDKCSEQSCVHWGFLYTGLFIIRLFELLDCELKLATKYGSHFDLCQTQLGSRWQLMQLVNFKHDVTRKLKSLSFAFKVRACSLNSSPLCGLFNFRL